MKRQNSLKLTILCVFIVSVLVISVNRQSIAESCFWVGVERANINSHQPLSWCPNGAFLVGFDLDGDKRYSSHDAPVVGQAMCCMPKTVNDKWGSSMWVGVQSANINSHQLNRWCPDGTYLVGLDLDGDKRYSPHDAPVVGQAMCASLRGSGSSGRCFNIGVHRANINSHQPNRWCPAGTYLVGLDLDGDKRYSPHDAPVVGQAMCCSLSD
jgi:hypothetical protein